MPAGCSFVAQCIAALMCCANVALRLRHLCRGWAFLTTECQEHRPAQGCQQRWAAPAAGVLSSGGVLPSCSLRGLCGRFGGKHSSSFLQLTSRPLGALLTTSRCCLAGNMVVQVKGHMLPVPGALCVPSTRYSCSMQTKDSVRPCRIQRPG